MEETDLPNKLTMRLKWLYKVQICCPLPIESFLHLMIFLLEAILLLLDLFTFTTESQISCIKLWMEDLDFQWGRRLGSKWRWSRGRCAKDWWRQPKWRWWRRKRKVGMVEDIEWLSRGRRWCRGHNLVRSKARANSRDYNGNAVRRKMRLRYGNWSIVRSFAFQASIPRWGNVDRRFSELLQCGTLVTSLMFCWLVLLLLTFLKAFLWDDGWGLFSFGDCLCVTLLTTTILTSSFLHHTIWLASICRTSKAMRSNMSNAINEKRTPGTLSIHTVDDDFLGVLPSSIFSSSLSPSLSSSLEACEGNVEM